MGKVLGYRIVEVSRGEYEAHVQIKGVFFTSWHGINFKGETGLASSNWTRARADEIIQMHKNLRVKPFVRKVVHLEVSE